jgi:Domain of unknown function (DUF4823)
MQSKLALGVVFLLLAACSTMRTLRRDGPTLKLSQDAQVFVALPADGHQGLQSYAGSGAMTLDAVEVAFKKHVVRVEGGGYVDTQDSALDEARRMGCSLLVIPEILHWEDQQTELSLERDVLEVRLILVNAADGETLDRVTLGSRNTLFARGSDHPEDMLAPSIGEYVDSLF